MAKWRPEGWENPYKDLDQKEEVTPTYTAVAFLMNTAFELGADAMLEALKKQAVIKIKREFVSGDTLTIRVKTVDSEGKEAPVSFKYSGGDLIFLPNKDNN